MTFTPCSHVQESNDVVESRLMFQPTRKVGQTTGLSETVGFLCYYCRHEYEIRIVASGAFEALGPLLAFTFNLSRFQGLRELPVDLVLSCERVFVVNPESKGFKKLNRNKINPINGSHNPSSTMRETFLESRIFVWRRPGNVNPFFIQRGSFRSQNISVSKLKSTFAAKPALNDVLINQRKAAI